MFVLRQPSELPQIQNEEIRDLIDRRIDDLCFDNYWNSDELGFFIVVEPGDSLDAINETLGFSILSNRFTEARFGDPDFTPCFEVLEEHPGFFAMLFIISDDGFGIEVPRWPLQIPPPVATQTPPGRTAKLSVFRVVWEWAPLLTGFPIFFGFNLNGCLASEARQAVGIGRGAVGRPRTPQGLSTGSSCGQVACPRRTRVTGPRR